MPRFVVCPRTVTGPDLELVLLVLLLPEVLYPPPPRASADSGRIMDSEAKKQRTKMIGRMVFAVFISHPILFSIFFVALLTPHHYQQHEASH